MHLTAKIKLHPTPEQHTVLLQTLETANAACNAISEQAWETQTFKQYALHNLVYHEIRAAYGLAAQMVVRAIGKVTQAYRQDQPTCRTFNVQGAFPYDDRLLSFQLETETISIWTLAGRQQMQYQGGPRQRELLHHARGETDLCYIDGTFYLYVSCKVAPPEPATVAAWVGVDLGIVNLAADSDGQTFSGAAIEHQRRKYAHRRRNLQRKGTRAAKRKLRQIRHKQQRFQTDTNHRISKQIVHKAQGTGRGIALEDLKGIRARVTVSRQQRARHANWAFHQLRQFITYKAALAGVVICVVDPRHTSRTCPQCHCVDVHNRRTRNTFSCVSCGYSAPADTVAAVTIAARAVVNPPNELLAQGSAVPL